jgi:hypothetical protein
MAEQIATVRKKANGRLEDVEIDLERFEAVYEELVDNTENISVLQNRRKNDRLHDALALMEYLRGAEDDNPLERWFGDV